MVAGVASRTMQQVGVVAQLWRYPVKSFQGEQVEQLDLGPGGAAGDRTLAVVDPAARKVLSAKRYADLLMAVGPARRRPRRAHAPGRHRARRGRPGRARRPVGLARPRGAARGATRRRRLPHGDVHGHVRRGHARCSTGPGQPGTWLDLADAHWLTTASLAAVAGAAPRRRRGTCAASAPPRSSTAPPSGFAEDAWTHGRRRVRWAPTVLMATPRCSMPSRAQPGLDRDKAIGTTIRDGHDNNLGVYASVSRADRCRVGDTVQRQLARR